MLWRRQWHPTPVLLPRKSHGRRSLVGCSPLVARVGHDWVTSLSLFSFMHWRRKWQPTPVFLPGESQGQGSLVGCRLWGRTESDTTKVMQQQHNMLSHSVMPDPATLWTIACQALLSVGFFRQESWSRLPFSSSRGSSQPMHWTHASCIGRLLLYPLSHLRCICQS